MSSPWGGTDLSYHLNENKLNLSSSFMNRDNNNVKKIASSGVRDISELCVNNLQCSVFNNPSAGARFTVPLSEGFADDSLQGFSRGHSGRVVTLSPPTSEAGVRFPAWPQVGKLVVACRWSAVYSTEP